MIFPKIHCPNFSRLVWRRHTKFQIGMAAAIPAIPLPAPRTFDSATTLSGWTLHLIISCGPREKSYRMVLGSIN